MTTSNSSPLHSPEFSTLTERLKTWHDQHGRAHLPWRRPNISPYEVWVSEVMLQQTQVSRVIAYYQRFLERFPTVQDLAQATWEEFVPYYQGLGYYNRGRNMLKTARAVVDQHQGVFPATLTELQALPGIGPYTARAILSFAFQQPVLAVDTNLQRVLGRYFGGHKKGAFPEQELTAWLQHQAQPTAWLNAALMDFANSVCTNRAPHCDSCPLAPLCAYRQTEGTQEATAKTARTTFPDKSAQTLLILHENHRSYYSAETDRYVPFLLPAPLNTRHRIQAYFARQYGLELAVRPPFQKNWWQGQPTHWVHAQVLLGTPAFASFSKERYQEWLKQQETAIITP